MGCCGADTGGLAAGGAAGGGVPSGSTLVKYCPLKLPDGK